MADLGHDLSCTMRTVALVMPDGSTQLVTAVQPSINMSEVSGRRNLAEACVRRITTGRGTLIDVVIPSTTANYGTDVKVYQNADVTAKALAQIGAGVEAELKKDERIVRAPTVASFVGTWPDGVLMLDITIVDADGPFKLILAIGQVTTTILSTPL